MTGLSPANVIAALLFAALLAAPVAALALDQPFLTFLLTRLAILAVAAAGLNLVLGCAGLPSFAHAALFGVGAYAAGIAVVEAGDTWVAAPPVQLALSAAVSAAVGVAVAAVALRARGIAFILITLALGQMLFYVGVALEPYGGDDGLTLPSSKVARLPLYYAALASLAAVLVGTAWLRRTPLGLALRGAAVNEARIAAAGIPLRRAYIAVFAVSAGICGVAGGLEAMHTAFVSPAALSWTRSAELVAIVLVGGAGTAAGPLFGAGTFVLLEELLSGVTAHWRIALGPLLVLVALYARGGIAGWIEGRRA